MYSGKNFKDIAWHNRKVTHIHESFN